MTTSTPPVTVVCFGASLITIPIWCGPGNIKSEGCSSATKVVPQQHLHLSQVPSQVCAIYAMGPPQVSFHFRVEPSNNSYMICLVSIVVFAFCFQIPMWMPCSPKGAQPLGFTSLQLIVFHPTQVYVPCGDSLWSMPGVHWVHSPLPALVGLILSRFLVECVTIQTSYSFGTLVDGCSLASYSSQHGGRFSSSVFSVPP